MKVSDSLDEVQHNHTTSPVLLYSIVYVSVSHDLQCLDKYTSSTPTLLSFRAQPSAWPGQHHRAQRDRRQEELQLRPGPQPPRGCILTQGEPQPQKSIEIFEQF